MSEHDRDLPADDPAGTRHHRFAGNGGAEQTTRIPSAGDREDTSVFGPFTFREDPPPTSAARGGNRSRAAGVLVAALLLGSAGGVAGAAGYDAANGTADEPAETTTQSSDEQVVTPLRPGDRVTTEQDERDDTPAPDGSPEAVAQAVLPSVVKINVRGSQGQGSGSGVILSEDGEILTNAHVVEVATEGGGEMTVDFNDGSSTTAEIVGTDPVTDLAVIRAEGASGLEPARIGDSEALDVGESVVAIGSPFGLTATVTSGIVSALNRPVSVSQSETDSTTYPAIQTDAAINPGNSGGPLVNLAGQVVGINSSIRSSTGALGGEAGSIGLGFAIPISKVLPIVDQLRNGETPTHARLGVTVNQPGEANDPTRGGLVTGAGIAEIEPGSSGDDAGLQPGDVVTRVDDQPITSVESLVATIRGYRPGDEVTLTVLRDDETIELEATLESDAETGDS